MIGGIVETKKRGAPDADMSVCPIAFDSDGNMCECDQRCAWRTTGASDRGAVCAVALQAVQSRRLVAAVNDLADAVRGNRRRNG